MGGGQRARRRAGHLPGRSSRSPRPPARRSAWLWPLTEPTHRAATGDFADDGLAAAVGAGGRLDRALAVLERLPRTFPPGGRDRTAVPVTLAIDPALVEELAVMAAGTYAVDGVEGAGRGTGAARPSSSGARGGRRPPGRRPALRRRRRRRADGAGLSAVVARSLPGTPRGNRPARSPTTPDARTPPRVTDRAPPATPARPRGAGILPTRSASSPAPTSPGRRRHRARPSPGHPAGRRHQPVVLSAGGLTDGGTAVGADGRRRAARTPSPPRPATSRCWSPTPRSPTSSRQAPRPRADRGWPSSATWPSSGARPARHRRDRYGADVLVAPPRQRRRRPRAPAR